jgi:hypothetical protein
MTKAIFFMIIAPQHSRSQHDSTAIKWQQKKFVLPN